MKRIGKAAALGPLDDNMEPDEEVKGGAGDCPVGLLQHPLAPIGRLECCAGTAVAGVRRREEPCGSNLLPLSLKPKHRTTRVPRMMASRLRTRLAMTWRRPWAQHTSDAPTSTPGVAFLDVRLLMPLTQHTLH